MLNGHEEEVPWVAKEKTKATFQAKQSIAQWVEQHLGLHWNELVKVVRALPWHIVKDCQQALAALARGETKPLQDALFQWAKEVAEKVGPAAMRVAAGMLKPVIEPMLNELRDRFPDLKEFDMGGSCRTSLAGIYIRLAQEVIGRTTSRHRAKRPF